MTKKLVALGCVCCVASFLVIASGAPAASGDCKQPTPAGDPCQECHQQWPLQHWYHCTGSVVSSECTDVGEEEDGWICTEVSGIDCPGKMVDFDDDECMNQTGVRGVGCSVNYSTATSEDTGDDPECPVP